MPEWITLPNPQQIYKFAFHRHLPSGDLEKHIHIGLLEKKTGAIEVVDILARKSITYRLEEEAFSYFTELDPSVHSYILKVQNFLALCRDPQPFCPHFAEDLFLLKHPSIKLMAVLGLTEYTDWLEIKKESPAILSSLKDNWKRLIKNRCQESLNSIQKEMESADPSVAAELNSIKGVLETIPNEADKAIDAANNLDEVIKAWPMLLNPSPLDIS